MLRALASIGDWRTIASDGRCLLVPLFRGERHWYCQRCRYCPVFVKLLLLLVYVPRCWWAIVERALWWHLIVSLPLLGGGGRWWRIVGDHPDCHRWEAVWLLLTGCSL
jgi:hypothetical protein